MNTTEELAALRDGAEEALWSLIDPEREGVDEYEYAYPNYMYTTGDGYEFTFVAAVEYSDSRWHTEKRTIFKVEKGVDIGHLAYYWREGLTEHQEDEPPVRSGLHWVRPKEKTIITWEAL